MSDSCWASVFPCGGGKRRRTLCFFTCGRPFDFRNQSHAAVCEAEVLEAVSLPLPEYPKDDKKAALICVSILKFCLCSSVQGRKVEEHSPGILVLFCWAAVGFRASHVWFFWAELSEEVFSMQMVYFGSKCESCVCKQGRTKLGICVTIQTPQTT